MNSITACMAYCMAKTGTKTVVVQSKTCACSSSKLHFKLCSHRHMNQKRLKNLFQFGFKTTLNDCFPTITFLSNNNYFASPEIIEVKICYRQTDKFFDTIYGVCGFFLQVKFATSLLASLAGENVVDKWLV